MKIYRKDFNYVQILPKAIVAAQETYTGRRYITEISNFTDSLVANTSTTDWSIRYFAAQAYLDLYARTKDQSYLDKAYDIAYNNVTVLLKEQRKLNATYLADVQEVVVKEPDYRYLSEADKKEKEAEYKAEVKRAKAYNKALKETRKTELPTMYEPLVLNCELLFALAEEKKISESEQKGIEAILQTSTNGIFVIKPINDKYSFTGTTNYHVEFKTDEILVPVNLLTAGATIKAHISDSDGRTTIDDFVVAKVDRKGSDLDTYFATLSSKQLKKYNWTADSKIQLEITYEDAYNHIMVVNGYVAEYVEHWYGDKVVLACEE